MNEYVYTPSGTCITKRRRELGWIPPSEDPVIVAKWMHYQSLTTRALDKPIEQTLVPLTT